MIFSFPLGEAIRCFECNSHNDTRCAQDIPPKELSIECGDRRGGATYKFCRKITQVIEFSVNSREFYYRKNTWMKPYKCFPRYSTSRFACHSRLWLGRFQLQGQVLPAFRFWWSTRSLRLLRRRMQRCRHHVVVGRHDRRFCRLRLFPFILNWRVPFWVSIETKNLFGDEKINLICKNERI
jgi:hypothetical protein